MSLKILTINPGSTSTKIGVFQDEKLIFDQTLRHSTEEIAKYKEIYNQKDFRKEVILKVLEEKNEDLRSFDVIVGRGGLLKPIPGGTYATTPELLEDLKNERQGAHASNLGGILAADLAKEAGNIPSFIVDPVVVDELQDVARISGHPDMPRTSIFHALNQKAIGKRYAKENNKHYNELNLIIAHLGGGITVGAHKKGQVIDVFNALDGEGAFSPERTGSLPTASLIRMCYSGKYPTVKEAIKSCIGLGGVTAYLGTNNMVDVENAALKDHDPKSKLIFDAFIYQVAKDIGAMAAVLEGNVDQILITGGIAYAPYVREEINRMVSFIAGVTVYPGEDELLALAQGAIRVLNKEENVQTY